MIKHTPTLRFIIDISSLFSPWKANKLSKEHYFFFFFFGVMEKWTEVK